MSVNNDVEMSGIRVDHCLIFKEYDNYNEIQEVSSVPNDSDSMASYALLEVSNKEYVVQVKRDSDMVVEDNYIIKSNGVSSFGTQINIEYLSSLS